MSAAAKANRNRASRYNRDTGTPRSRQTWTGLCKATGKRMYPDRAAAKRVNRMGGLGLHAYFCRTGCGKWHLGSLYELSRADHTRMHANDPSHLDVALTGGRRGVTA